jgi:hypothetical protein
MALSYFKILHKTTTFCSGIFSELSFTSLSCFNILYSATIFSLLFPKSKKENGFWTFINVQKWESGKSLGKTCFEKSLVTIMLSK